MGMQKRPESESYRIPRLVLSRDAGARQSGKFLNHQPLNCQSAETRMPW